MKLIYRETINYTYNHYLLSFLFFTINLKKLRKHRELTRLNNHKTIKAQARTICN